MVSNLRTLNGVSSFVFFFSSRRRHTRYWRDWSSDVCSSDLCLDTVVTLAAALEQAGIRPLLWVAEGHAFLGYWREERSAESVATTDVAPLVNLVDLGLIRLVETTLLTSRGSAGADLHAPAYSAWLAGAGDLDRVLGVTDVHRARRDGIVPLPARKIGRASCRERV